MISPMTTLGSAHAHMRWETLMILVAVVVIIEVHAFPQWQSRIILKYSYTGHHTTVGS